MKAILRWLAAGVMLVCLFTPSTAQESREAVRRFTFGTPDSVTRDGFTKVTVTDAFTPVKGYGFQSSPASKLICAAP